MAEGQVREVEAPFNMAIATLKRIDIILQQIKQLYNQYPHGTLERQKAHIDLVKQLYLNSVPLLENVRDSIDKKKKEDHAKFDALEKEILGIQVTQKCIIKSGSQRRIERYSYDLEKRLHEITAELQKKLKRFFMPGKREAEGLM